MKHISTKYSPIEPKYKVEILEEGNEFFLKKYINGTVSAIEPGGNDINEATSVANSWINSITLLNE